MTRPGPIVIIGFKGSGKSLIGGKVAARLGLEFVDTDAVIERIYSERHGKALGFREIYKAIGGDAFRKLEAEASAEALSKPERVVSLGGGTLMNEGAEKIKKPGAVFVMIKVEKETLFKRIMKGGVPAFIDGADPRRSFDEYLEKRAPVYDKFADITVDNTNRTPDEVADEIIAKLKNLKS